MQGCSHLSCSLVSWATEKQYSKHDWKHLPSLFQAHSWSCFSFSISALMLCSLSFPIQFSNKENEQRREPLTRSKWGPLVFVLSVLQEQLFFHFLPRVAADKIISPLKLAIVMNNLAWVCHHSLAFRVTLTRSEAFRGPSTFVLLKETPN